MHINPELTMGENIADLDGVTIAYAAFRSWLKKHTYTPQAPFLGEGGGEQAEADRRFLAGWAQVWRNKYRPESLEVQLTSDPHLPASARSTIPLQNLDVWYSAYGMTLGQHLFREPDQRVTIW